MNKDYQLSLLCLTHLLVSADGILDKTEADALEIIRENEKIGDEVFLEFRRIAEQKKERDIYHTGIDLLNRCSDAEKMKVFVMLYKLSEVDGRVHVKEIRLLLYSIKLTGVEFNDVVNRAMAAPSLI
jgi:uncharacterized tellurite resistance protein B-like protein